MQTQNFSAAARAYADLVGRLPDDGWDGPGLGAWDLRALVGHTSRSLITVETYLQQPAAQVDCVDAATYYAWVSSVDHSSVVERGIQAGRALGDDPRTAVAELVERVVPLVDRDDDPLIHTIAGGMYLSTYLPTRTIELVVHCGDIAAATGVDAPVPGVDVLAEVFDVLTRAAALRGLGPELLRALTGRSSLPPGFSLV